MTLDAVKEYHVQYFIGKSHIHHWFIFEEFPKTYKCIIQIGDMFNPNNCRSLTKSDRLDKVVTKIMNMIIIKWLESEQLSKLALNISYELQTIFLLRYVIFIKVNMRLWTRISLIQRKHLILWTEIYCSINYWKLTLAVNFYNLLNLYIRICTHIWK